MATLFTRIIEDKIPSVKIHDDDLSIAILDIAPINKGHILVIAKEEYETILECPDFILSHLMITAKKLAERMKKRIKCDGFNIMINNGTAAGQEVPHIHVHVIPRFINDGKSPSHVKECYEEEEMLDWGKRLAE